MKNQLKPLILIVLLCFSTVANAQFLKKLGERAEKAAERTLERKVEEKAEKETDKAFDSAFNNNKKSKKSKKQTRTIDFNSSTKPESTYSFSHKYTLLVDDGKNQNQIIYYLTNNGDYFATSVPNESMNMISIMDINKKTMFMLMDNNGTKNLMSMSMNFEDIAIDAVEDTNYSIKPTGNTKTIVGYLAKEFEVSGDDMYGTVWITNKADISFSNGFYNEKQKKGINKSWMKLVDGLFLEMTITDTSKRKPQTVKMTCVSLEKENFSIHTSDYKKMM